MADTFALAGSIAEGKFPTYYAYNYNAPFFGLLPVYQMVEASFAYFQVGHIYLFMVLELILMVYLWIKRKTPPWLHLGLGLFLTLVVICRCRAGDSGDINHQCRVAQYHLKSKGGVADRNICDTDFSRPKAGGMLKTFRFSLLFVHFVENLTH